MAWLRLFRIAALPSAISNLLIGFLLANGSWQPASTLVCLVLSSASLYLAGMVLNDVFDIDTDRMQRPSRPLPSGAISLSAAQYVGFALLVAGPLFAFAGSLLSFAIAGVLAAFVYLYDGPLKRTVFAPFLMGSCRTLNILLGASTAISIELQVIAYAVAIGVFVGGITWLARREAEDPQTVATLYPGSLLMVLGMLSAGYCASGRFMDGEVEARVAQGLPVAFAFVCLPILRRLTIAISSRKGSAVQAAVVSGLRSLIVFDACLAMLIEQGRPMYSLVLLALLGVSWLLGKATKLT